MAITWCGNAQRSPALQLREACVMQTLTEFINHQKQYYKTVVYRETLFNCLDFNLMDFRLS